MCGRNDVDNPNPAAPGADCVGSQADARHYAWQAGPPHAGGRCGIDPDAGLRHLGLMASLGFDNLTALDGNGAGFSHRPRLACRSSGELRDLAPGVEAVLQPAAVVGGGKQTTADSEEIAGPAKDGKESLCFGGRFEALHPALPDSGRLVGLLDSVIPSGSGSHVDVFGGFECRHPRFRYTAPVAMRSTSKSTFRARQERRWG